MKPPILYIYIYIHDINVYIHNENMGFVRKLRRTAQPLSLQIFSAISLEDAHETLVQDRGWEVYPIGCHETNAESA